MDSLWKYELYRIRKSKVIINIYIITIALAAVMIILLKNDIRLGISLTGDLALYRNINDMFLAGLDFRKGSGILAAIMISLMVGNDFNWGTLKLKMFAGKSRTSIYFTKLICSVGMSISVMLLYEIFLGTGFIVGAFPVSDFFNTRNLILLLCGLLLYGTLGIVFFFISMICRSSVLSVSLCLCYVLLSDTFASLINALGSLSNALSHLSVLFNHSMHSNTVALYSYNHLSEYIRDVSVSSLLISAFITLIGFAFFVKSDIK